MSFRRRLVGTALIVVACGGPALVALALRASRDVSYSPIVADQIGWPALVVALDEVEAIAGRHKYAIQLAATSRIDLVRHDEIRIRFATYQSEPIVRALLRVGGTRCLFESPPGSVLPVNQELRFVRGRSCVPEESVSAGDLELIVELSQSYPVAIWTIVPPVEFTQPGFLFVSNRSSTQPHSRPIVRGTYVDAGPTSSFRRVDLLNHVWGGGNRPVWIPATLGAALLLLLAGGLLVPLDPPGSDQGAPALVLRTMGAMCCLAAGLALSYAVIVPPFEAPDEPDHLLSFAKLTDRPSLAQDAAALAKRGHLERIKFRGSQRFRPVDVDRPFSVPWGEHVEAEDVRQRSSTTAAIWLIVAPWLQNASAAATLLSIRLTNVLVFGLSIALGSALIMTLAGPLRYPQLGAFVFLFVPALPFFAMHMSEYAWLTSTYVLLSCCLLVLFLDGPRSHYVGLPLGLSTALTMANSRSTLPLVPLIFCVLFARIAMGSAGSATADWRRRLNTGGLFWGGFVLGAGTFHLLVTADYTAALWTLADRLMPASVREPAAYLADHEWILIATGALACALETVGGPLRRRLAGDLQGWLARGVAWTWAAAIAAVMISSLFQSYPSLPTIGFRSPGAGPYVVDVLGTMLTTLRFGNPDLLLFSSFWTGFGWIDTIPSSMFVSSLAVATGLSWIALLVRLGRTKDSRRMLWLLFIAAGLAGSLALYALASHSTARDVHGRYLIGFHLSLLSIVWVTPALIGTSESAVGHSRPLPRPAVFFTICGMIHAYCLSFIVTRYF